MDEESQRLIHCCYCSENLPEGECNYCLAKRGVREVLSFPPAQEGEDLINRIFDHYNIAPKTRLLMLFELEQRGDWT